MKDKNMVNILRTNPQKGIKIIMDQFAGLVYCIIYNKVSAVCSKQDIEECVSDVFFAVYQQRDDIDLGKAKLKTYICVIAKRKAITLYHKALKNSNTVVLDETIINTYPNDELHLDEKYINKENRKTLILAINRLGKIDKEIIIRKYFALQSSKEIGEILDMTVNAIDLRVHRALRKLENEIKNIETSMK